MEYQEVLVLHVIMCFDFIQALLSSSLAKGGLLIWLLACLRWRGMVFVRGRQDCTTCFLQQAIKSISSQLEQ